MVGHRRILVSLPDTLLKQLDTQIQCASIGRDEFIRRSVEYYILECQRRTAQAQVAAGYQAMGSLNLAIARETEGDADLSAYERALAEGD